MHQEVDSLHSSRAAAAFFIRIAAGAKELFTEIVFCLLSAFFAVGEEEWGTINHVHVVLVIFVVVGKPLRAFPILFASSKFVEPLL